MKNLLLIVSICTCLMTFSFSATAEVKPVQRTVLGVYDSKYEGSVRYSYVHSKLEMVLNFLGYRVEYQDVRQPLKVPDESVKAVIVWLPESKVGKERDEAWLTWLNQVLDSNHKLILIGDPGFSDSFVEQPTNAKRLNQMLNKIGVRDNLQWFNLTYDAKITYADPALTGFERQYRDSFRDFESYSHVGAGSVSHLQILTPQYEQAVSDLIITHPRGAYIDAKYALYDQLNDKGDIAYNQWYINPFRLLQKVLDDNPIPKADVTTYNGRRIFYSHIDGDGWNSLTELEEYKNKRVTVAEALYAHIFSQYTDIPFTVGVVAAELMPQCYGVPDSEKYARQIFALSNVEPGNHTYSHPLYWGFFAEGNLAEKEKPFLDKYPAKPYQKFFLSKWFSDEKPQDYMTPAKYNTALENPKLGITSPHVSEKEIFKEYVTPRSFACETYDLGKEIGGSVNYIESLAGGKKVKVYQWSGDTKPYEAALGEVRLRGLYNINGGVSRYDVEFPSYTSVSSIGVPVGAERQIYSSNTNENDYTDLWTGRFFGFRYLQTTVENTEIPVRVHPFNIYFHSYSGQKQASLNALKENLKFAKSLPLFPMFTSEYLAIANSFYGVEFVPLAQDVWEVRNRGSLQTIRFDQASLKVVDINKSKGVLGQKYLQGSLYVALDESVKNPVIALKSANFSGGYPSAEKSYLIESNWKINGLKFINNKLIFTAAGFGKADMLWKQPSAGKYNVRVQNDSKTIFEDVVETAKNGQLHLTLPASDVPLTLTITPTTSTAL